MDDVQDVKAQDPAAHLDLLKDLVDKAVKRGADAADALFAGGTSLSVACRLGQLENLDRSESNDVGLRVFKGKRQAVVSSSDHAPDALDELVERALAMAESVPEDPWCGLAEAGHVARDYVDLEMCEPGEPSSDALLARAIEAEDAARTVAGVTNSEGAEATWGRVAVALVASNGFSGVREATHSGISASVLAGEGTAMERDYDYASAVFGRDLPAPAEIGRSAGERAVARLNPRKISSAQVPVVYEPRVSRSLLGHLASAVNGAAVARGTSFLKDRMNERVFAEGIRIVDDPLRPRGLRSKPFDAEGIATKTRDIVADGVLRTWFLDLRSARQLGLESTGHASRGTTSPPSPGPTNLYLAPGTVSPEDLMAGIPSGLYVTEMIGFGVNQVTGDYSRGASGFWIENGERAYPVSEITIAGNLRDMFLNLTPADDLELRYGTDAPTVRVDGMTVAGK